ncbi:MAG: tRNA-dihydrouridine synthase family protein [Anaerolineaceae bacterium]
MDDTPKFKVGNLPVYGDLILAPMDGISDSPFRSLMREMGSAMSYTEFINVLDLLNGHPFVAEHLRYNESERPVVYQLFDDDPERILRGAQIIRAYHPDVIDINMGCSNKSVSGRGAGAGLLRTPEKIARIISNLTHTLDIPITAKIRLGWDNNSRNYLQVAKIIEENGGACIAVHGRTRQQTYKGIADWEAIGEIKQVVKIPVIANGDVRNVADIERIQAVTNCDGVMIGRAALTNPWIFSRRDRSQVPPCEVQTFIHTHLERNLAFYGEERGLTLLRKYVKRLLLPYPINPAQLRALMTASSPEMFCAILDDFFQSMASQNPSSDGTP